MDLTWHAFDLLSGRRGEQLAVQPSPPLGRIIGEPTEAQLEVLCWDEMTGGPIPGWETGTEPGRSMLVALDEDEQPVWGGMVLRRRSDSGVWVGVDLATCEAYFDRRFVSDHTWTSTDQAVIVTGLVGDATETGIGFTVDAPDSGTTRDRTYFDDEDKSVLSVLQDLMGVDGGPEFTVDLEWADETRTVLDRVVRVRNRIGRAMDLPDAVFEMPGAVVEFSYIEDYSSDHGATDVMAVSSGEGDIRPESDHFVASDLLAAGWARFEHRFTPSTSITSTNTLNSHARYELAAMKYGLRELTLEAHLDTAPRIGSDFHLGDDVAAVLTCPRFPARVDADGAVVPGYERNLRCIGWEIDTEAQRLRPRLVEVD